MTDYGKVIVAKVTDATDKKVYAQKDGVTYQVINGKASYNLGDQVEGFAYSNRDGKDRLSVRLPEVSLNSYAWAEVVQVKREFGVFVDIGLPDKDILVSLDDLPSEYKLWPQAGDRLYIKLKQDKKGQIWADLADDAVFAQMSRRASKDLYNEDIQSVVYNPKLVGSYVFTTDQHLGFIHPNERDQEPRLGQVVDGRIIDVKGDGSVNISLRPRNYEVLEQDAAMIYEVLRRSPDQKIPFTDKSDPEAIRDFFGISKAQFKRSIGRLMKLGLVEQKPEEGYSVLIKELKEIPGAD